MEQSFFLLFVGDRQNRHNLIELVAPLIDADRFRNQSLGKACTMDRHQLLGWSLTAASEPASDKHIPKAITSPIITNEATPNIRYDLLPGVVDRETSETSPRTCITVTR